MLFCLGNCSCLFVIAFESTRRRKTTDVRKTSFVLSEKDAIRLILNWKTLGNLTKIIEEVEEATGLVALWALLSVELGRQANLLVVPILPQLPHDHVGPPNPRDGQVASNQSWPKNRGDQVGQDVFDRMAIYGRQSHWGSPFLVTFMDELVK